MTKNTYRVVNRLKQTGFTLIELVVVIIMIGILSVTVIPKFFESNGFEEIAYQAELVTKLRSIQLRAMHQTNRAQCDIIISTNKVELKIYDGNDCLFNTKEIHKTTKVIITENGLSFDPAGGVLSFDSLGRPDCGVVINACTISISGGEQTKTVTINDEGYIYASN
jgi:MSHA pilin protein MshC